MSLLGAEIANETVRGTGGSAAQDAQRRGLCIRPMASPHTIIKVIAQLEDRATGDQEEMRKFLRTNATKAFSDVPRNAAGRVAHLGGESHVQTDRLALAELMSCRP